MSLEKSLMKIVIFAIPIRSSIPNEVSAGTTMMMFIYLLGYSAWIVIEMDWIIIWYVDMKTRISIVWPHRCHVEDVIWVLMAI